MWIWMCMWMCVLHVDVERCVDDGVYVTMDVDGC